jgi:hypothetical protein
MLLEYLLFVKCLYLNCYFLQVDTTCSYTKRVGTTSTKSKSNTKTQETSSNQDLTISFIKLGFSQTTGYNWAETNEESFQKEATTELSVIVPAGVIQTIQQVVGKCGDTTLRTEQLIISHEHRDGNSSCIPTDAFEVLITCDATNSVVTNLNCKII